VFSLQEWGSQGGRGPKADPITDENNDQETEKQTLIKNVENEGRRGRLSKLASGLGPIWVKKGKRRADAKGDLINSSLKVK